MNYKQVIFFGLTISSMITASVVTIVGKISYIGLIIPNIVVMFKGDKIKGTLIDTALLGALFVLICDMIARSVIMPYELPIELIVGIIGSVMFIAMLIYKLRHGKKAIPLGKAYVRNLLILTVIVAAVCGIYLLINSYPEKPKMFRYVLSLRIPTLMVMLIASFAIGSASIIFQSIINNRIVTPCLLGMNSMYTLVHTAVVFVVGSGSIFAVNANLSFAIDLIVMSLAAIFVYSYMFRKTGNNVLYVLLIGTVLSSFFGSIQSTMIRVMDPNEYDTLLTALTMILWKNLKLLDVITLGKDQAINLGVDYDRTVRRLLLGVVFCIAAATAMVGPISFLGLMIANQHIYYHRRRYLLSLPAAVRKRRNLIMNIVDLMKNYDGKTVVNSVSFEIPKGKVLSMIGPNGAGKSTVMGMISRLIAKDSGVIDFEDKDLSKWKSKELAKKLSILIQHNNIQMKLTVRELVAFGRFPYSGNHLTAEDHEMIDKAIAYMELQEIEDRFIDELSGGQRQ